MSDIDINLLIEKFWNGTASALEKQQLLQLLDEQGMDIEQEMLAAFGEPIADMPLIDINQGAKLLEGIQAEINSKEEVEKVISICNRKKKMFGWAAAILILIGCGMVWKLANKNFPATPSQTASILKLDTVFNQQETIKSITLPDESKVRLYPGSYIAFEPGFWNRDVQLSGKATFQVVHDARRIFSVRTGDILTTDLGTIFEIDARKKTQVSIQLIEGKIKVGKITGSTLAIADRFLNPGEILRIDVYSGRAHLDDRKSLRKQVKKKAPGRLAFNKTPLETVFKEIAERYRVAIEFDSEAVRNLSFSGTVEANDSLPNILEIICYMNNLKCSQQQDIYTIRK